MRLLIDNYGAEAAGPCLADVSGDLSTSRGRQQSIDSGYHSTGGPAADQLIHGDHTGREHSVSQPTRSAVSLSTSSSIVDSALETDEDVDGGRPLRRVVGREVKGKGKGYKMKRELQGTVGLDEVAVSGEMSAKAMKAAGGGGKNVVDRGGYFGLGKKWPF